MMKKIVMIIFAAVLLLQVEAQNGINTVEHVVEKGQTLYFLSKKYDLSIEDIMRFNPQIEKDMIVKEGMILKFYSKPTPTLDVKNYKYHTVVKGQTLYSLSKLYNISIDDLIYLNQLENPSIGIGDELIVQNVDTKALFTDKNDKVTVAKEEIPTDNTPKKTDNSKKEPTNDKVYTPVSKEDGSELKITNKDVEMYKMLYDGYAESGATLNKEKGIGNFLEQSSSKDVYLALVKGITSGQVIRVRNLMNNKVIYLKVVGSVPSKDESSNISIKISKAAARDLKIVEDRFLAEWTWYKKEEEKNENIDKSIRISDF